MAPGCTSTTPPTAAPTTVATDTPARPVLRSPLTLVMEPTMSMIRSALPCASGVRYADRRRCVASMFSGVSPVIFNTSSSTTDAASTCTHIPGRAESSYCVRPTYGKTACPVTHRREEDPHHAQALDGLEPSHQPDADRTAQCIPECPPGRATACSQLTVTGVRVGQFVQAVPSSKKLTKSAGRCSR